MEDEVVVVSGKVDGAKIIASEIILAQDFLPDIYFNVPPNLQEKILGVLKNYGGESSVYFKINGKWRRQNLKVTINKNLREELKNLLGAENFRIY